MESNLNKFNQYLNKYYYVNHQNDIVIKGIMQRVVLSELEQKQIVKEIALLRIKKELGESPSILQQLCLAFLFEGTY